MPDHRSTLPATEKTVSMLLTAAAATSTGGFVQQTLIRAALAASEHGAAQGWRLKHCDDRHLLDDVWCDVIEMIRKHPEVGSIRKVAAELENAQRRIKQSLPFEAASTEPTASVS